MKSQTPGMLASSQTLMVPATKAIGGDDSDSFKTSSDESDYENDDKNGE